MDEKDCIDYYEKDPTVKQIWTYMEGFHNAPEFIRSVRRVSRSKPVMVLKANRGNSGAKASASHSASLAANDAVCDQLLRNVSMYLPCEVGGRHPLRRVGGPAQHRHGAAQPAAAEGSSRGRWVKRERLSDSGDGRGRLRRAAGGLGGHVPDESDGLLSRDDQEVQGDLSALLRVLEPDGPHRLR